jgi:hypothetical protein
METVSLIDVPEDLITTLLHLLDLRSVLAMTVVSKRLSHLTSNIFNNHDQLATLGVELFGFKPLKCSKADLVKALRVSENILNARFSYSRLPPFLKTTVAPQNYEHFLFHNNLVSFQGKSVALPSLEPVTVIPKGYTCTLAHRSHATNINALLSDVKGRRHVLLMDGKIIPITDDTDARSVLLIGDVVVFISEFGHFDTSDVSNTKIQYWKPKDHAGDQKWVLCGYVPEGVCFADTGYSKWQIISWKEISEFRESFESSSGHYTCTTFVSSILISSPPLSSQTPIKGLYPSQEQSQSFFSLVLLSS